MPKTPTRPAAPPTSRPRPESRELVYSWFEEEDRADGRGFRLSLVVALAVHLAFLFATIPTLASKDIEKPEAKKYVKLAPTPKFKKKPPVPKEPPPRRHVRIPIPDPTPDEVEIYVDDEVPEPVIEMVIDEMPFDLPEAPPEPPQTPIRVGGDMKPPHRTHFVRPAYTEIARKARQEGIVVIELVVDKKGQVAETQVLRGLNFGLTEEALKAVRQWRFEPSTLNGKPIEIIYVVTVHFELN